MRMPYYLKLIIFLSHFTVFLIWGGQNLSFASEFPAVVLKSTVSVLPIRAGIVSDIGVKPEEPEGSGIAVFDGSYIATAAHVLSGAEQVRVRLTDGRILPASIVGQDDLTDIALMRISTPLPPFSIIDVAILGAEVCTVGNQFGLGLSVTCGVISAIHRSNAGFNGIEDFVQTDAVMNPGASGGALVNGDGKLLGMLSGIFTKGSDANIGVNFAVHGKFLMRVLEDLKDYGRVKRAKSGMVVQTLELDDLETQTGVRVVRVAANSAAWKSGLRPNDVIVAMVGREILYPAHVSAIVYGHRAGDSIPVEIVRNGHNQLINLILGE